MKKEQVHHINLRDVLLPSLSFEGSVKTGMSDPAKTENPANFN